MPDGKQIIEAGKEQQKLLKVVLEQTKKYSPKEVKEMMKEKQF